MSGSIPVSLTTAGRVNTPPATLNANLIAAVQAVNPGYTANLPGSLIEDISSTDTYALVQCDQFVTELINSVTPYGANEFILAQLGAIYGVLPGTTVNTSVYCVFSSTSLGFVIAAGFTVSDGTYQYIVQDGGVIESNGQSIQLYCVATQTGSFAVPPGTVTQLVTSLPTGVTMTVTNPNSGTPQAATITTAQYRAQVLQAGYAPSQGSVSYLKTLLGNVAGVQSRLVAVKQIAQTASYEIIVGGGDPYAVAYAIYQGIFFFPALVGSTINVTGITNANPGVVTVDKNPNYPATGQIVVMQGVQGMTAVNGVSYSVIPLSANTFSINANTSEFGAYTSGGVVTPNIRNISVSINDYPDTYVIPFVNPPQETVAMTLTWNTSSPNFVSVAAVSALGNPALVNYVNTLPVGQPMNLFELQVTFQESIVSILPAALLTRMVFAVSINGTPVSPESGTGIISGDPESFFFTQTQDIVINQG